MRKRKKILKNVGLGIMGLGLLGAGAFGVSKLVEHINADTTSVHLSYDVGGLNSYGKYEENEGTIYTKDKFACEGLNAILDFDSQINYQIFYYDISDNFISSTDVLKEGYHASIPTNAAYARIEITPINDEDGKISFFEKLNYGKQLNVKVSKNAESNVSKNFVLYKNKLLRVVNNIEDLVFDTSYSFNDKYNWVSTSNKKTIFTSTLLKVNGSENIEFLTNSFGVQGDFILNVYEFSELPSDTAIIKKNHSDGIISLDVDLDKSTKYVLLSVYNDNIDWATIGLDNIIEAFILTK